MTSGHAGDSTEKLQKLTLGHGSPISQNRRSRMTEDTGIRSELERKRLSLLKIS